MVFEAHMAEGSSRLLLMPRCYCPRNIGSNDKSRSLPAIAECDVVAPPQVEFACFSRFVLHDTSFKSNQADMVREMNAFLSKLL
jgi:hypothetical protein